MSLCSGCPERTNYKGKCSPRIGMQVTHDSKTWNVLECNVCKALHFDHYREAKRLAKRLQSLGEGAIK